MPISRKRGLWVAAIVASTSLLLVSVAGQAAPAPNAYVVTKVNQRAGPGTDYPVVFSVPPRAYVTLYGCVRTYAWCDVGYQNSRGWMLANYLQAYYQNRYMPVREYASLAKLAVVAFDVKTYWDAFYRNRAFYGQLAHWIVPHAPAITASTFYRPLASHGSWVWLRGQYVWVPNRVDASWRPYTVGHWAFTQQYGWFWVSDEPFGWATYHYGRWGFSKRIGWFWIPGTRWAPAWVSWRESDDYLAWAPLPPARDDSISIEISIGSIPDYYWQVVPSSAFLSDNVSREIIRDDVRFVPVLEETRPVGNVTIINNVVVNNVINVQYVEQKTQEKVVVHDVVAATNADQTGTAEGGEIKVFTPPPSPNAQAVATEVPPEIKRVEDVAAASQTNEQAGNHPATEELVVAPPTATPSPEPASKETVAPGAVQEAPAVAAPAQGEPPPPPAEQATPTGGQKAPLAEPPPPAAEPLAPAVTLPAEQAAPPAGSQEKPAETAPVIAEPSVPLAPAVAAPIEQFAPATAQEAPVDAAPPLAEPPAPLAPAMTPPAKEVASPADQEAPVEQALPVAEPPPPAPEPMAPAVTPPAEQVAPPTSGEAPAEAAPAVAEPPSPGASEQQAAPLAEPPAAEIAPAAQLPAAEKKPVVSCPEGSELLKDGTCSVPGQ